ncbi:MAG: hypothetical protein AB1635_20085 [Acidobacteriota bacterium]
MTPNDSPAADRIVLGALQWNRLSNIEELRPIDDRDYEVLRELRDVLWRHGFQDRFGICLLHKHFELAPGEIALEETDSLNRVSTIRVEREESCSDATETAWRFSTKDEIRAGRNCTQKCRGYGMTGHQRYHECKPT